MFIDRLIGNYILPAQRSVTKGDALNLEENGNSRFSNFMVPSANGSRLDTLVIYPNNAPENPPYIIYFCGMRGSYTRKINRYQQRAEKYGHVAICFNYTNVGNSTGHIDNQNQLISDGKAQVQRLLDLNVPANKITLYGLSLGGAIAAIITADFQIRGLRIKLISDRSFTTLLDALPQALQAYKPAIAFLLSYFNWTLNATEAIKNINLEDILLIVSKVDKLIDYRHASLYQAMKPELKKMYGLLCYKTLSHTFKISNGITLNESRDDMSDPESKFGVHGALLENLIDKDGNAIIETIFRFAR